MYGTELQLTTQDLTEIKRVAGEIQIEGDRYPANLMAIVGR
jgi:hypothetical protein